MACLGTEDCPFYGKSRRIRHLAGINRIFISKGRPLLFQYSLPRNSLFRQNIPQKCKERTAERIAQRIDMSERR